MFRSGIIGKGVGVLLSVFADSASAWSLLDDTKPKEPKQSSQILVFDSLPDCDDALSSLEVNDNCFRRFEEALSALPKYDTERECLEAHLGSACTESVADLAATFRYSLIKIPPSLVEMFSDILPKPSSTWRIHTTHFGIIIEDNKTKGSGFPLVLDADGSAFMTVEGVALEIKF